MPGVRRHAKALAALALAVLAGCLSAPAASGSRDETILVSRQSAAGGGAGADADSGASSISADGRHVAFVSAADNLSAADDDTVTDVFVRDLQTSSTSLVSRQSAADGGVGADGVSAGGSISADGRYVAFASDAGNLSAADDDTVTDVFVRDLQTSSTSLVSRQSAADGGAGADGSTSNPPSISADGRFVAFESSADNLSDDDDDDVTDIFVRDRQTNSTTLVSRQSAAGGGAGGDGASFFAAISADGRYVAFVSDAGNLSAADSDDVIDVFVRDLQTSSTTLVSRQSAAQGGAAADGGSGSLVSISADGRHVAFASDADNLSAADSDALPDIYLRDTQANATTLVSRQSAADGGAGAEGASTIPSISADGRYVAFNSNAGNLSRIDNDDVVDVFVRDVQASATTLVSRRSAADGGAGADGDSAGPSISADGRFIAFGSEADNLSALDSNGVLDVFLRDLLGPPDTAPPRLSASARRRQTLGGPVKVKVACDEACRVVAEGTVKLKGRRAESRRKPGVVRVERLRLRRISADLAAGETTTLRLRPSRKARRALKRAATAKARITVGAADAAGNAASARLRVGLG